MYLGIGDKIKVTNGDSSSIYTIFKTNRVKAYGEDDEFGRVAEFQKEYTDEKSIMLFSKWYIMDNVKRELIYKANEHD